MLKSTLCRVLWNSQSGSARSDRRVQEASAAEVKVGKRAEPDRASGTMNRAEHGKRNENGNGSGIEPRELGNDFDVSCKVLGNYELGRVEEATMENGRSNGKRKLCQLSQERRSGMAAWRQLRG